MHNIRLLRDAGYDDDDGDSDDDCGVDVNVGLQLLCRKPVVGHSCNFL